MSHSSLRSSSEGQLARLLSFSIRILRKGSRFGIWDDGWIIRRTALQETGRLESLEDRFGGWPSDPLSVAPFHAVRDTLCVVDLKQTVFHGTVTVFVTVEAVLRNCCHTSAGEQADKYHQHQAMDLTNNRRDHSKDGKKV